MENQIKIKILRIGNKLNIYAFDESSEKSLSEIYLTFLPDKKVSILGPTRMNKDKKILDINKRLFLQMAKILKAEKIEEFIIVGKLSKEMKNTLNRMKKKGLIKKNMEDSYVIKKFPGQKNVILHSKKSKINLVKRRKM